MRRRLGSEEEKEAALNLTPTIDVVFLLLIFFVATLRLPEPEANLRAYLPRTENTQSTGLTENTAEDEEEEVTKITIGLRRGSGGASILFNGAKQQGWHELAANVESLRHTASKDSEIEMILDADSQVELQAIIRVLDICSQFGFRDVSFAMPKQ
jgi:biopolymer transport protein ExbD